MPQAEAIGLSLIDLISDERAFFNKSRLEWSEEWFNIAFRVAQDHSEGVDVLSENQKTKTFAEMNGAVNSIDWEVLVGESDALSGDALSDALKALTGGERATQTHTAIAAF